MPNPLAKLLEPFTPYNGPKQTLPGHEKGAQQAHGAQPSAHFGGNAPQQNHRPVSPQERVRELQAQRLAINAEAQHHKGDPKALGHYQAQRDALDREMVAAKKAAQGDRARYDRYNHAANYVAGIVPRAVRDVERGILGDANSQLQRALRHR